MTSVWWSCQNFKRIFLSRLWSWVVFFALMGCYHSAANSCRYWLMRRTFVVVPGNTRLIIHWRGLNPRSSWVGAKKRQRNLWKPHLKGLFFKGKKTPTFFFRSATRRSVTNMLNHLRRWSITALLRFVYNSVQHTSERRRGSIGECRRRHSAVKYMFLSHPFEVASKYVRHVRGMSILERAPRHLFRPVWFFIFLLRRL